MFAGLDHLSHSSLSAFDCPWRGYQLVVKKAVKDRSISLVLGSAFHEVAEQAFLALSWDESTMLKMWPDVFDRLIVENADAGWTKVPSADQIDQARKDGEKMIKNLFKSHSDVLRPPHVDDEGPWVERGFSLDFDGMKVIGFIDLVLANDDGTVTVCDWKTGKHLPHPTPQGEVIISGYEDQLQLYALACRFKRLRVREVQLVFPRLGKVVSYTPTVAGFNRQRERTRRVLGFLRAFDAAVEAGQDEDTAAKNSFPAEPHEESCRWCVFKDDCAGTAELARQTRAKVEAFRRSLKP